jgi:2-oxo-3-hexenedioate decarboxylase
VTDPRVVDGLREQLASWRAELQGGARRIGWKIGFNVPAIRETVGLEEPALGHLTSATLLEDGVRYSAAGATALVVEPEVAVEIAEGGGIGRYAPAIEVADLNRPFDELQALIAENIFHRGVLFGEFRPTLEELPAARVTVNGEERATATAPDDYFDGVVELAAGLLAEQGERLHADDRIICGVITPIVPVGPGDAVEVDFGPLGLLRLSVT